MTEMYVGRKKKKREIGRIRRVIVTFVAEKHKQ